MAKPWGPDEAMIALLLAILELLVLLGLVAILLNAGESSRQTWQGFSLQSGSAGAQQALLHEKSFLVLTG